MSTSFMTVVTLSADRAYEVLSRRTDGKLCVKQAIAAVITNNTGAQLTYETLLESGKVEVNKGIILPDYSAVVQPQGEFHVLIDPKGRNTAGKLYDMDNPMKPQEAFEMAALRGLSLTQVDKVMEAMRNLTIGDSDEQPDPRQVPWTYVQAKGRVIPFRCGLQFVLPKPTWGPDAEQYGEIDSAFVVNVISNEVYLIGRQELVSNWLIESEPGLNAKDFWNSLPVIRDADFNEMIAN